MSSRSEGRVPRVSSQDVIVLGGRRRARLEAIVSQATAPQRLVLRAKIVLAAWRGSSTASIARQLGLCVDTVRTWRHRFAREGMPGLADRPRSGRPPIDEMEDQLLIVATITGPTPETDSHWTHRALAGHLREPLGIRPPRSGGSWARWTSNPTGSAGGSTPRADPAFPAKAQAVCRLHLDPPTDTVLFSVDEKTAMHARSRTPGHPPDPARPG